MNDNNHLAPWLFFPFFLAGAGIKSPEANLTEGEVALSNSIVKNNKTGIGTVLKYEKTTYSF